MFFFRSRSFLLPALICMLCAVLSKRNTRIYTLYHVTKGKSNLFNRNIQKDKIFQNKITNKRRCSIGKRRFCRYAIFFRRITYNYAPSFFIFTNDLHTKIRPVFAQKKDRLFRRSLRAFSQCKMYFSFSSHFFICFRDVFSITTKRLCQR